MKGIIVDSKLHKFSHKFAINNNNFLQKNVTN